MLVLSRQRDQSIMIGDGIEITVVSIGAEEVVFAVSISPHIPVYRKEVGAPATGQPKDRTPISRAVDQVIMIGDDIEIMVVYIRNEKVRLGISAPQHIPVHRKEVYDSMGDSVISLAK